MTLLESLIAGLIVAVFTGVLGLLIGGRSKVTVESFEAHRDSSHPHPALPCEIHTEKLNQIDVKLDQIDEKLNMLVNRLIDNN